MSEEVRKVLREQALQFWDVAAPDQRMRERWEQLEQPVEVWDRRAERVLEGVGAGKGGAARLAAQFAMTSAALSGSPAGLTDRTFSGLVKKFRKVDPIVEYDHEAIILAYAMALNWFVMEADGVDFSGSDGTTAGAGGD